jgi:hypothetical protein
MSIKLSPKEIDEIHGAAPFNPLFPNTFLFEGKYNTRLTAADQTHYQMATWIDAPPKQPVSSRPLHCRNDVMTLSVVAVCAAVLKGNACSCAILFVKGGG